MINEGGEEVSEKNAWKSTPHQRPISRSCEPWKIILFFLFAACAFFLSIISQLFMICLANGQWAKKYREL